MKKIESGFSLIELLVVVAIIGILAAVGTVGYGNYIKSSKLKATAANVANIASAIGTEDSALAAGIKDGVCGTGTTANASATAGSACITSLISSANMKNPYDTTSAMVSEASCTTEGKFTVSISGTTLTVTPCTKSTGISFDGAAITVKLAFFTSLT
jgi:type IV pilus assembly protein PilA